MAAALDIIGSLIIKTAIVMIILNLNMNLHNALYQEMARAVVKQNLSATSEVFLSDIRLAGYNAAAAFSRAEAAQLDFAADLDNDGAAETVRYYLGPPESDGKCILYRQIGSGQPLEVGRGIDSLRFRYYNANGAVTSDLAQIKSITVKISMLSHYAIGGEYQRGYWERQVFPLNLR